MIDTESTDTILANESTHPEKVVRDQQGRILTLYRQYANQGERVVSGIDVDLRYKLPKTALRQPDAECAIEPSVQVRAAAVERRTADQRRRHQLLRFDPEMARYHQRHLELGQWTTNAAWNCVDGYEQTTRPGERVKPFATVDLNLGYKISAATSVNLLLANAFDRKPSWDSSFQLLRLHPGRPARPFRVSQAQSQVLMIEVR